MRQIKAVRQSNFGCGPQQHEMAGTCVASRQDQLRESDVHPQKDDGAGYTYETVSVADAIHNVRERRWDVPGFQRAFVWRPQQICQLAESLWMGYPVGSLLLWRPPVSGEADKGALAWVADGQQRLTSLCLLAGQVPPWWEERPRGLHPDADGVTFCFDVEANRPPWFVHLRRKRRIEDDEHLIELAELLRFELTSGITAYDGVRLLAARIKQRGGARWMSEEELCGRLLRVCMIRQRLLMTTVLHFEQIADVREVFERLNSRGMRFRRMVLKLVMSAIPELRSLS